jgi:filamentous hemagglutinin family protein
LVLALASPSRRFSAFAALRLCVTLSFLGAPAAWAGDILRGGAPAGRTPAEPGSTAAAQQAAQARSNAKDVLARTSQALDSVKAMQAAANKLGAENAGADPNHPGQILPNVPNGLAPGGLQVAPGATPGSALWKGAGAPQQSNGANGVKVTIKQTDPQAVLNWQTFNVGRRTTLTFDQSLGGDQVSEWTAFNKVLDPSGSSSQILGSIQAPGQVYVINQNGIIFAPGSQVNARGFTASSLPINDNLIERGLLNNPDAQFLFSSLPIAAGAKGTPAFTPPPAPLTGDVTVQAGAVLASPSLSSGIGGRITLVGRNVTNKGTIQSPDGQAILAAGLQVGFGAHSTADPTLRGLDTYIGSAPEGTGVVNNLGLIQVPRGNATLAGREINHFGVIDSTTSVSFNGRVDLLASYDAVSNPSYDATAVATNGPPFLPKGAGKITLGAGSAIRVLPELDSLEKVASSTLALPSLVNIQGKAIHLESRSTILAPGALLPRGTNAVVPVSGLPVSGRTSFNLPAGVTFSAGTWRYTEPSATTKESAFTYSGGQIYLEPGAVINVAGTPDVAVPILQNLLTLQLRGAELADSPLQRGSFVNGPMLTVDIRDTGVYNGVSWVGTPLGNIAGYVNLIERTIGQLTTAGGTVSLRSGGSVVLQAGSEIDVSGGYISYEGGMVQTTRLLSGGRLVDIADATPDREYDGIYTGTFTKTSSRWGVTKEYTNPLAMTGAHYEPAYQQGANGGMITINAPSVALDGTLKGQTVAGDRQRASNPVPSTLSLSFTGQNAVGLAYSPTPPTVTFQSGRRLKAVGPFELDAPLPDERVAEVVIDPGLFKDGGFGNLFLDNAEGEVVVPADTDLELPPGGALSVHAANIRVEGQVRAPAGSLSFTAYNYTPYPLVSIEGTPPVTEGRGQFTLGPNAVLSTAGMVIDDRPGSLDPYLRPLGINTLRFTSTGATTGIGVTPTYGTAPVATYAGGSVLVDAYGADFAEGSLIDVSGGVAWSALIRRTYGNGGSIDLRAGRDPRFTPILGGTLALNAELRGYSGATGGSLSILAPLVQIGGASAPEGALHLQPEFFRQGGFTSYTLTGLGRAGDAPGEFIPAVSIAPGTVIEPVAEKYVAFSYPHTGKPVELRPVLYPAGSRVPVSLGFNAPGVEVTQPQTQLILRGDFVMGEGAVIRTDADVNASVSINAQTAAILGEIYAPGGSISVRGAINSLPLLFPGANGEATPTVYLGPNSVLSTAGAVVYTPDARGYRTGTVLPGGSISVRGNIVAAAGALLDVSGTSAVLDLAPVYSGLMAPLTGALNGRALQATRAGSGITYRGLLLPYPLAPADLPLQGSLTGRPVVPTRVDSDGGTITLEGGQMLYTSAELRGEAGGPAALGGTLIIGSDRTNAVGANQTPLDPTLVVQQGTEGLPVPVFGDAVIGQPVRDGAGNAIANLGYFGVDRFYRGGFDSLELRGTVQFQGPIQIDARGSITVGRRTTGSSINGGVIIADSPVTLRAPYVALGLAFPTPFPDSANSSPYTSGNGAFFFTPSTGGGSLAVHAELIDIGTLALQNFHSARFYAEGGDIRGNGILSISGDLLFRAAQVYPTTAGNFLVTALDRNVQVAQSQTNSTVVTLASAALPPGFGVGSSLLGSTVVAVNGAQVTLAANANAALTNTLATYQQGSVTIEGSGTAPLPLSAGGTLRVYASSIYQRGTLRAPFGSITLGWDGTGTAPVNPVTNTALPIAQNVVLAENSVTSVSAIDPLTGRGVTIPYGIIDATGKWIDPLGRDITTAGPPTKNVSIGGVNVSLNAGATIDLRGGGDLYAYQWIQGNGGSTDVLATNTSFAVLPGYYADYAPFGPNNSTSSGTNLISSDPGYYNPGLKVGDRVYLGGSQGLPAGYYTLLPARYALLEGAFLVTPQTGAPVGSFELADGSSIVNGYRVNTLNAGAIGGELQARFAVASGEVIRERSEYAEFYASQYFPERAQALGLSIPLLPFDAGRLVISGTESLNLQGMVLGQGLGGGRGAYVDLSSLKDFHLSAAGNTGAGGVQLSTKLLNSWGAESLFIGGTRTFAADGTTLSVRTNNITVAGDAFLSAPEIILAAKQNLDVQGGARIISTGAVTYAGGVPLLIGDAAVAGSGDGVLLRVSTTAGPVIRRGVSTSTAPTLSIGPGALISGEYLTLDSTANTLLDPTAQLVGDNIYLSSGRISILLENPGALQAIPGLVLTGPALARLQAAKYLSLTSYSTLDLYGTGVFSVGALGLHMAEIRGFNQGQGAGGVFAFSAGSLSLDNVSGTSGPGAVLPLPADNTLLFEAGTISLGAGLVTIDQFANVDLRAGGGLFIQDAGGLLTRGDLVLTTPLITGAKLAQQAITAAGDLVLRAPAGGGGSTLVSGLAASLTLTGANVTQNTNIYLPSGAVTLRATGAGGLVTLDGRLDVSGTVQQFYDVTGYTGGGSVQLTSDSGSVNLLDGAVVDVSAPAGGANAGAFGISAAQGAFNVGAIVLDGFGGAGGIHGKFILDTGTLPGGSTAEIDSLLNAGGFTESRNYRVRTGDVLVDGAATSHEYTLSTDQGSVTVTGSIDASGARGGKINLLAAGSLTLEAGSVLNVAAQGFDAAGKGGAISLEAGGSQNGVAPILPYGAGPLLDIRAGSALILSVAANTAGSAANGQYTGTLHLRAPQTTGNTDLQLAAIGGNIVDASRIAIEGYRTFTPVGGVIDSVKQAVFDNGTLFAGGTAAMTARIFASQAGLAAVASIQPGAEIVNTSTANLPVTLNTSGSSGVNVAGGVPVTFAAGTPGIARVAFSVAGTVTVNGVTTAFAAGQNMSLAAGSIVTLNSTGNITYFSGAAGPISLTLPNGTGYTSIGNTTVTPASNGGTLQLNAVNSAVTLAAGTTLYFPAGTPGNNQVRFASAGSVTTAAGVTTNFAANTNRVITPGSTVTLTSAGAVTYFSGTGGAIPFAIASGTTYTTNAGTSTTNGAGELALYTNWDLSGYRFGPNAVPGNLTLRAAGNIAFNVIGTGATQQSASLSDGFAGPSDYDFGLWTAPLMDPGTRSWSYRIVAGADLGAADFRQVRPDLPSHTGSVLLGRGSPSIPTAAAPETTYVPRFFQTIRTGTGDIDIVAGRDVQFLNPLATIYTAGTQAAPMDAFDVPEVFLTGTMQDPIYPAQFSLGGGDVRISAENDIARYISTASGLVVDSTKEMVTNWLYRRNWVNPATGTFDASLTGTDVLSTAWWIDYANFFQGVGALGGGNVSLAAGRDVINVDAVAPTNARMPGYTDATKTVKAAPDLTKLQELGGGDVTVTAGRDISGGVYYVERGQGSLLAGNEIRTNSARAAVVPALQAASATNSTTWLPTTLFLGKGGWDATAGGNLLLGSVVNPFLLPQGSSNSYLKKTYFSTYAPSNYVRATSVTGDVTLRAAAVGGAGTLAAWYQNVLLSGSGSTSLANSSQQWLRLVETNLAAFTTTMSLYPGSLFATAFQGDVNVVGTLNLYPSPTGTLELLAYDSINGLQVNSRSGTNNVWASASVNLSDANPASLPGVANPLSYAAFTVGSNGAILTAFNLSFAESGSYTGQYSVIQTQQALHGTSVLHANDPNPVRLYAGGGDISGLTLYTPKAARILADRDIKDVAFYLQNTKLNDVSLVSAGRDIVLYAPDSAPRTQARTAGNQLLAFTANTSGPASGAPTAGDIQIGGPGYLQVLAGRHLDLGDGRNNPDGTGVGITSIGGARNPNLGSVGAEIIAAAGLGVNPVLDPTAFLAEHDLAEYLDELGLATGAEGLSPEAQAALALRVFFLVLRDAGRAVNAGTGTYEPGFAAIESLFPAPGLGDITTRSREIRTIGGGNISLLAPGGSLTLQTAATTATLAPPGIITESGGSIGILTDGSVNLGISRIFTLRGGDIVIWSSTGDIAAGNSAKTVQSAPPTRVIIDAQSAAVSTDLAGLATGGGIGVLATVAGVEPGSVDLIAPVGVVDAGDAGIRSSGDLNIAATQVLNADNIQVTGTSVGTPVATAPPAPPVAGLTQAGNTAVSGQATATQAAQPQAAAQPVAETAPSIITVEVIGYGGEEEEEDEEERRRRRQLEEESTPL